ncbi:methyltransferase domain-containing protein [Planctomycetota bacterium]
MKEKLLSFLCCPKCKNELRLMNPIREHNEIKTGLLQCNSCQESYPIQDFIPRFVETDKYVDTFSFEWKKHQSTQLDSINKTTESKTTLKEKTGFDLNDLKGKLVLDAGCGMGRFMEVVNKYGGEVVGVDLSFAVEAAFENMGLNPNYHIIQADIFELPFKPESFDYIFSIGVLHHTSDTQQAFSQLVPLLKKGGKVAIWVYDAYLSKILFLSQQYRRITVHLPKWLLYFLSHIALFYYYLIKIPFLGHSFHFLLPISCHPNWRWRVLDTFDWYSPKYQWKHTYPEVYNWFKTTGLKNIRLLKVPVALSGEKD